MRPTCVLIHGVAVHPWLLGARRLGSERPEAMDWQRHFCRCDCGVGTQLRDWAGGSGRDDVGGTRVARQDYFCVSAYEKPLGAGGGKAMVVALVYTACGYDFVTARGVACRSGR